MEANYNKILGIKRSKIRARSKLRTLSKLGKLSSGMNQSASVIEDRNEDAIESDDNEDSDVEDDNDNDDMC